MVGLTATPYRGVSHEETERLVNRYGARRLDKDALGDDPYAVLQEMGVLAKADTDTLPGDEIDLDPEELASLERLRRLPPRAEAKLGESVRRNRALLAHIRGLPDDWPVILFATSVAHAQTMAALLTLADISAATISGETPPATRRDSIERFRSGGIRVLTNYGVLTQGFDAPSVRALVHRPPDLQPEPLPADGRTRPSRPPERRKRTLFDRQRRRQRSRIRREARVLRLRLSVVGSGGSELTGDRPHSLQNRKRSRRLRRRREC